MFASSGDEKPLYRAELKTLNTAIGAALAKSVRQETRAHLEEHATKSPKSGSKIRTSGGRSE